MKEKLKKIAKQKKEPLKKIKLGGEKIGQLKRTKIRVIGIGGGGGNIVSELAQRVKKATFLAANTDLQALKQISGKVERFPFGRSLTQGLGTGMNPELAEMASQNEKEKIKKIFQGQDLVILIACLGGGTGSGATPVFAKLARSGNCLTYGIFTLPFKFEGEKKMEIAKRTLKILKPKLNAITIIPNERIFQIVKKTTPLKEAFSAINKSLAQSLEGLIETIYRPGLINIDFADLKTILEGRGRLAYLNTLSLPKKEGAVKEGVERALTFPLYPYSIKGAKGVLFNIAGEKGLTLEEVSQISKIISEKANSQAKIIFGISPTNNPQNIIKTTIFATGCSAKFFSDEIPKKLRRKKIKQPGSLSFQAQELKKPAAKKEISAQVEPFLKPKKGESKKPENLSAAAEGKIKVKVRKNTPQVKKDSNSPPISKKETAQIRKNALQIKKEAEEEEKEMLKKEKFWEIPAFLRKKIKISEEGKYEDGY